MPGVTAGMLLVFVPLMGDYITPTVLGGASGSMVGQMVAAQFQSAQNWALGSAMAVLLMLAIFGTGGRRRRVPSLIRIFVRRARRVDISTQEGSMTASNRARPTAPVEPPDVDRTRATSGIG